MASTLADFVGLFNALGVSMRNVFRKPTTVHFPFEIRPRAERFRASFALVHDEHGEEACIGCKACQNVCPSDIIVVVAAPKAESPVTGKKRGYCEDFTLNLQACIICELCVQVCPTDAIVMTRETEVPGYAREDLVLTMDKLYANERSKPRTWAAGSSLMEMQDPKRGEPPPEKKPAAPAKEDAPA